MATENVQNAKSMKMLTRIIGLIAALVVGLITFIIVLFASKREGAALIFTAIGSFICGALFATALFYLVYAIWQKNRFSGIIAYFGAALGLVVLLILIEVKWYFVLLVAIFMFIIFWLVGIALYSKKLTLVADNEKPEFKTYEQRKAEEAAKPAEPEEELPEIKSFKD